MNLLVLLILVPVVALLLSVFITAEKVKNVILLGAVAELILCFELLREFMLERAAGNNAPYLFEIVYPWFKTWNINFHAGVDGISVSMLLLTSLVTVAAILVSWKVDEKPREFFMMLMLLTAGAIGFFISMDLIMAFFFLELAVVPKFLLIAHWGSGRKVYSATKLALMLMAGSSLILVGTLLLYVQSNGSFDITVLQSLHLDSETQRLIFPLMFLGFGVFTALFPFHTWVPDGHSSAPTAGSMFLAGISMKLGGYGCIRFAAILLPEGTQYYSSAIILLSTIAIVYGAFATLMQKDIKYINAYSSVSHCGFVLLGIGMLNQTALTGAVLQMISHGLMTALFFGAIGMIYSRAHTRDVRELGGLLKIMPFIGSIYIIVGLCSLGLPGLSGFVSEMTIFMGAWQVPGTFHKVATILACASIVVTAVYILQAVAKVMLGPVKNSHFLTLTDATWYERSASWLLMLAIIIMGILPMWLAQMISHETAPMAIKFLTLNS